MERGRVALASLAFAILLQCLTFAYFYGRLSERVDAIGTTTKTLLDLQLQKTARGN